MKIDGKELNINTDYLSPVTYIPEHVNGNTSHEDCEQGVIISFNKKFVGVLYCKGRTVQSTRPEDLRWG